MQEKIFRLFADLCVTEKILEEIPLQKRRMRDALIRRISEKDMLSDKFGKLFVLTLEKGGNYDTFEQQEKVRVECRWLRELTEVFLYGTEEEWKEWSQKSNQNINAFTSWVQKPARFYLAYMEEERNREIAREAAVKKQSDIKLLSELSDLVDLDAQEEVDRLYESLRVMDSPYFQTWIGQSFVEQLQKRTSRYQKNKKQRKILYLCSLGCFLIFIVLLFVWIRTQQLREQEQWKNKVWDEIRNEEEQENDSESGDSQALEQGQDIQISQGSIDIQMKTLDILPQYQKLHDKNPDLVGWLQVPGIQLSLPVMQHLEDDSFYLSHNFEGESVKSGALFVDSETFITNPGKNIVIYGHNMSSGDIFGNLSWYNNQEFFSKNPQFFFDTIYEEGTYEIIAVIQTHIRKKGEEGFRYYEFYDYTSKEEYQEFVDFVKENELYDTGIQPEYGDNFVMLSTCEYSEEEGRLVVIGRKE